MTQDERPNESTIGMMRIADIAKELAVSPATARRLIASGELPSVRIGKKCRRVLRSELQAYIQKGGSPNVE